MTKVKVYLKIAKTSKGYSVEASTRPTPTPLRDKNVYRSPAKFYPTIFMGLEVSVPEEAFDYASQIIGEVDFRHREVTVIEIPPDIRAKIKKLAIDELKK